MIDSSKGRRQDPKKLVLIGEKVPEVIESGPGSEIGGTKLELNHANPPTLQHLLRTVYDGQVVPLDIGLQQVDPLDSALRTEMVDRILMNLPHFRRHLGYVLC